MVGDGEGGEEEWKDCRRLRLRLDGLMEMEEGEEGEEGEWRWEVWTK